MSKINLKKTNNVQITKRDGLLAGETKCKYRIGFDK